MLYKKSVLPLGNTDFLYFIDVQILTKYGLLRSEPVEHCSDDSEDYVRQPEGKCRRQGVSMYEHLAELQEKDVRKGKSDTGSDVPSDSSPTFL